MLLCKMNSIPGSVVPLAMFFLCLCICLCICFCIYIFDRIWIAGFTGFQKLCSLRGPWGLRQCCSSSVNPRKIGADGWRNRRFLQEALAELNIISQHRLVQVWLRGVLATGDRVHRDCSSILKVTFFGTPCTSIKSIYRDLFLTTNRT